MNFADVIKEIVKIRRTYTMDKAKTLPLSSEDRSCLEAITKTL